jgi:hypothetical protein
MFYVTDTRSLLLLLPLATAVERGAFDTDGRIIQSVLLALALAVVLALAHAGQVSVSADPCDQTQCQ